MTDMKQIHDFAVKWCDKFRNQNINYIELVDHWLSNIDMFPQTAKQRKRLWICSLARKISKDIQPIQSSHIETVVLMSRVSNELCMSEESLLSQRISMVDLN